MEKNPVETEDCIERFKSSSLKKPGLFFLSAPSETSQAIFLVRSTEISLKFRRVA